MTEGKAIYHSITKEHKWQQMNDLTIQNSSETESDKMLGPHFSPWFTVQDIQQQSAAKSTWWGICFKVVQM